MDNSLNLSSKITSGSFKNKTVESILTEDRNENKKIIFNLIKEGFIFSDEVLEYVGIKKKIRNVELKESCVEHEKDTKTYPIDTIKLEKILESLYDENNYNEE